LSHFYNAKEQAVKKVKRKWKRQVNKIKKLRIGTHAMNLGMFIIGWFLVVGIAVMYVRGFGMKTIISNDSMAPTFEEDEILKINQFIYKITSPKRMDTVAVRVGETKSNVYYVLRIVGLPGEKVQIQNGKIYIDGEEITYPVGEEPIEDAGIAGEIVFLGDDEYFMLCDNYNNSSYDSRSSNIGVIDKSQIEGRVK